MIRSLLLSLTLLFVTTPLLAFDSPVKSKAWTFIVFLNGDNNLDSFGDTNLTQMKAVGSNANLNIVVLRDRYSQTVTSKIYYVEKGNLKTIKDYGKNIDMGDWHQSVELFRFAKTSYPADHYAFVYWNHGGGWKKAQRYGATKDISWDDHTGNFITTPQLGQALAEMKTLNEGKPLDILGFDACLMQMAEVAGEVKGSVDLMVGSEEVEPGEGWDYNALSVLSKRKASAEALGGEINKRFVALGGGDVQGSTVNVAGMEALELRLAALALELKKFDKISKTAFGTVRSGTQAFEYSDYRDLLDFLSRLKAATTDQNLKELITLTEADAKGLIKVNYTSMPKALGLSIWLPSSSQYSSKKAKYEPLLFNKATGWGALLAELYKGAHK